MPAVVEGSGPAQPSRQDVPLESLKDRISLSDMGTRLVRDTFQLPPQKPVLQDSGSSAAFDELLSFVFKYYSDLPDETLAAAAEGVVAIMHDNTLMDDAKKAEVESLLGEKLSSSVFNELYSITSRVDEVPTSSVGGEDDIVELLDDLNDSEASLSDTEEIQNSTNTFMAINDPIRLRRQTSLLPQDIDAHWLENKLKATNTALPVEEVLDLLSQDDNVETSLLAKLGIENAALAHLLATNADVVLWYTRLHRAATGPERELLLEQIHERGLDMETLAENELKKQMDLDPPPTVDLRVAGRPVDVAVAPNLKLPDGSTRFTTRRYEQYNIPASAVVKPDWPLKPVGELPEWAKLAFTGIENLNLVQSRACEAAVNTDINLLLCAPTGAGKTNVALLALARCLHKGYKAVYIAPLKALVQEQVRTMQTRLPEYSVAELSGDQSLSRDQLARVDVLVATPEKWDIVTRKASNTEILRSIGLVIIDEIHLLHDEKRGSVLENIVARHTQGMYTPRLLGLSATLPNYDDIGEFLKVPPSGLLYFDAKFRPVPLEQKYVGVTANSPIGVMKAINEACAEKVAECLKEGKQILVFVHSRKDTQSTAKLLTEHESTKELVTDRQISVHHAGLDRQQRATAEAGFVNREYKVLVCTATLAWGVNLPAAAVIIKGTQFYDPSQIGWRQLQPQDVLQMLGRAGRPGFDASGLGVILTEHKYLSYFASVATMKLPIQSHLISRILESLNAEVSFGIVRSLEEAVDWLKRTFWYVRASREPGMYGMNDITTKDIAHSALCELGKLNAVVYEYPKVRSTLQGRIASDFYLSPTSVNIYCQQLKPWLTEIDLLRVFALSAEFASLPVRRGEDAEIKRLSALVPLPIREESTSNVAKVCVLAQAYICKLRLEGLALSADLVYIAQSASRIFRAMYQLAVAQKWSHLAAISLRLYVAVDKRQWYAGQTAFRQFPGCPAELIRRAESSQLPWNRYFDLETANIGEALRLQSPHVAELAAKYLSWFPRFELRAKSRPLTRSVLQVDISINPLFEFNNDLHRPSEQFYLMIENQQGTMLEWKALRLSELLHVNSRCVTIFMPSDKYAPYLFARLLSDKWLHSESSVSISLRSVLPPAKFSEPLTFETLGGDVSHLSSFSNFEALDPVQRALLPLLYGSDISTYVGLPPGTRKTIFQEMVISRAHDRKCRVIFITPKSSRWAKGLAESFSSRYSVSTQIDDFSDICFITSIEAERLSRTRSHFQQNFSKFNVVICDDLQRMGSKSASGWLYEIALSRIVRRSFETRIVGFGLTIATARAMGQWLQAKKGDVANLAHSSGLEGPSVEVRHWDGSLIIGLRDFNHDFESDTTILLIVADSTQCDILADELIQNGCPSSSIALFTGASSEEDLGNLSRHKVMIGTFNTILQIKELVADKVILFGTQNVDKTADLPVVDVLDLLSKASAEVVIYTEKQQYYAAFLNEPLPLESCLADNLVEALTSEIADGGVSTPQDAVDWLVSTYLYRRLRHNPSYYGSGNLEEWISDMVEDTFDKLAQIGAVELQEDDLNVSPLAPAHIATYYGVNVEALVDLKHRVLMKDWNIHSDENLANVRLLDARADLAVAQGDLASFFSTVDARQSLIQSIRVGASPLLQIPYIDDLAALKCQDAGITSVQEFVAIEDDELRSSILGFDNDDRRMLEVANFVNHYPIVDITTVHMSENAATMVIERDIGEEDDVKVIARDLPTDLVEGEMWYVVVGDFQNNRIHGAKKVQIASSELHVEVPLSGTSENMSAWLVCNSYIDADKEFEVTKH